MRWTPWIFPLGAIVGGAFFPFPIAILLYWLANSAATLAQQHLAHRAMATDVAQTIAQAAGASSAPLAASRQRGRKATARRKRGRR